MLSGASRTTLHRVFTCEMLSQEYIFFNKQSIFDPRPENCLTFSKESSQKIV